MAQSIQPGRFGQSSKPDDAWLAKQDKEPILEAELPIIDTHHHLWERGGWTYLLPELLADLNTGHNIISTVFEECRSMYRANGPVEMRPVGEVEFVAGIAAMSASGGYRSTKVAQGIVGYADLALGDRVEPVLEALIRAGGGRLSGVRYSAGYDADPTIGAERCTFESNFPVDKMGTGYATLWNAFKRITAGCSAIEKLALYSGTARRLYHLD